MFNLAQVHEAIAAAIPERECIVQGDRRSSWAEVTAAPRAPAKPTPTGGERREHRPLGRAD